MTIKVLIADDHAVVAEGLRFVVESQPDMQVIGCVEDGREAVRCSMELHPDVVLIDHEMPELNGTEAVRIIRERSPRIHAIVLSMHSNGVHVMRALQAGANGYVVKKSAAKEVVEAIRVVHAGRRYLGKQLADEVIDQVAQNTPTKDPLERLSTRERQVLQLLAEGHAIPDVASTLSLSKKTVETYRNRLMEKLEIHDVAGLVRFAIQHGVTPLD